MKNLYPLNLVSHLIEYKDLLINIIAWLGDLKKG